MNNSKFFKLILAGLSVSVLAVASPSAVLADSSNSGSGSNNRGPRRGVVQVRRRAGNIIVRHSINPRRQVGISNNQRRSLMANDLRQKGLFGDLDVRREDRRADRQLDRREDRRLDSSSVQTGAKIRRQGGGTVLRRSL